MGVLHDLYEALPDLSKNERKAADYFLRYPRDVQRFTCDTVSLANAEREVSISGVRILLKTGIVNLSTPKIDLESDEDYDYNDDLSLDIDAVKYEVKQYIEEKKWGVKQASIDFKDIDPYKAIETGEVPEATSEAPKKGKKGKKVAVA